tara:strand:- start:130 stop:288 length:159 start_codon:yes stop_codon:yes gene_type:complete
MSAMTEYAWPPTTGIITDMLEDETGFYDCLVLFAHGEEWVSDIQLEVISESR